MPPHGWWNIQRAALGWLLDFVYAHAGSVTFMQGLLVSRMSLQVMSTNFMMLFLNKEGQVSNLMHNIQRRKLRVREIK